MCLVVFGTRTALNSRVNHVRLSHRQNNANLKFIVAAIAPKTTLKCNEKSQRKITNFRCCNRSLMSFSNSVRIFRWYAPSNADDAADDDDVVVDDDDDDGDGGVIMQRERLTRRMNLRSCQSRRDTKCAMAPPMPPAVLMMRCAYACMCACG